MKRGGARAPQGSPTRTRHRPSCAACSKARCSRRGVSLSVQAAPFRSRDNEASVALAIEVDGSRLPLSPPGKLEVSFYSVNDQGRAGAGVRKEIDLALKPDTVERVKSHGLRLNPRMALAPGRYQLRFGARESSGGQNGSVFYDLIVPDFRKEELAMSGLLLTSVAAQQTPTADPDPLAAKQLPGAVTSRRDFPVGDTLGGLRRGVRQQPFSAATANRRRRAPDLGAGQRRVHREGFDVEGAVEHLRAVQARRSGSGHVPPSRRSAAVGDRREHRRPRDTHPRAPSVVPSFLTAVALAKAVGRRCMRLFALPGIVAMLALAGCDHFPIRRRVRRLSRSIARMFPLRP